MWIYLGVSTFQFLNSFYFLINSRDLVLYCRLEYYGTEGFIVKLLYFSNLCVLDQANASCS